MESVMSFIKSEKIKNDEDISKTNDKLNSCSYQIEEIDNMVIELSKSIDTTYEIFSPNAFDKDNNIIEIEKLNLKKSELKIEIESLNEKLNELEQTNNKIDESLEEMYDIENQLASNVKNTQYLISKEVNKTENIYHQEITNFLEMQIEKDNHYIKNSIMKKFDSLENKISLCENFIDMDSNRAKLELNKLKDEFANLEKKVNAEMFHVKHDEESGLYKSISDFIKEYQKLLDIKIDFKYSGIRVSDSTENIINIIRIVKETIDNANKHSNGTIVNVNIIVDKFESEINNSENESSTNMNNSDIHQINFKINNETMYNVNIIVTDNGDGFTLQDDKVLNANNLFGISIMKYRSKILKGTLNIESSIGMGTTVKLIYQIQ